MLGLIGFLLADYCGVRVHKDFVFMQMSILLSNLKKLTIGVRRFGGWSISMIS